MSKVTTILYGDLALLPLEASIVSSEILEWKTDLFISDNGTEDREKLRANARRKIFYKFFENYVNKIPGLITEYGAYDQLWAVPLWMERQYIGSVTLGTTVISCTTDIYDFRDLSLALLYESRDKWQIIEIDTVGGSQLNLTSLTGAFTAAYLFPVRIGTIVKNILRESTGWNVKSELVFEIVDVLDPAESVPSQYLSNDYYTDEIFKIGPTYNSNIQNNMKRIDFELGKIYKVFPWTNNRIVKPFYNMFETQQEIFDFRQQLTRRSGKYRSYWEPTFEVDLTNQSIGLVEDILLISSNGFLDWDKQREHLAIVDTSGTWFLREIISTNQDSSTIVSLTLDSNLDIQSSTIDTISFLGLRRYNTDSIELKWDRGAPVMETTVNTIEISP